MWKMKIINWFKSLNLPNQLTVIRVLLIPFFLFFLYISGGIFKFLPLLIFAGAALTDAIDGFSKAMEKLRDLIDKIGK
jgi:CDP-diacylglycerol--glycerol-3-phosphate 3-phosphatidyltransferase